MRNLLNTLINRSVFGSRQDRVVAKAQITLRANSAHAYGRHDYRPEHPAYPMMAKRFLGDGLLAAAAGLMQRLAEMAGLSQSRCWQPVRRASTRPQSLR